MAITKLRYSSRLGLLTHLLKFVTRMTYMQLRQTLMPIGKRTNESIFPNGWCNLGF